MTVRKKAARLLGTSDPCPTQPFLPRRSAGPIRWSASERQSKDGAGHSAETTPLRGEAGRQVGGDWCASRCLVGHASSGPLCYLGVWGNPRVARTVLTPGLGGRRDEMAAEVLSSAKWLYCGEPDESQRAVLVQFSNGKLRDPGNMRFTLYKNNDSTNPRKRTQRILAAETDRLCYVGNNFGTGALKCNTLCRHFVGILNKTSGQMEVYDAELFNMQPLFSDESIESELTLESEIKTFREKMDSCIEAFGTTKQKRALNSRRMNTVGSESLNRAVAKAAENIIDTKGVTALVNDAKRDDMQDDSLYLPPCHADAAKPEDVYKFEDLLSPAEYEALQSPSEAFRNVTSEEILKMIEENSHCSFVIEALKSLPSNEESRDRQARCIWFLDTLIKFRAQKVIKRKSALGPGIPHIISTKLLKHFTCLTYNNGSLRNLISDSMKAKITAYVIILALHINDFQIDLTMLQRDLKLSEKRMIEIAKAMRLKISKRRVSLAAGREEDHRLGALCIPLPPAQTVDRQAKRRRIT